METHDVLELANTKTLPVRVAQLEKQVAELTALLTGQVELLFFDWKPDTYSTSLGRIKRCPADHDAEARRINEERAKTLAKIILQKEQP